MNLAFTITAELQILYVAEMLKPRTIAHYVTVSTQQRQEQFLSHIVCRPCIMRILRDMHRRLWTETIVHALHRSVELTLLTLHDFVGGP
jgi:hypothetical protein